MLEADLFGVVVSQIGDVVVFDLLGELDSETMPLFEQTLAQLLAKKPRHIIFDVSSTEFISSAGYEAIGRCSLEVGLVSVCSTNGCAKRVLQCLGYDKIVFFTVWSEVPVNLTREERSEESGRRSMAYTKNRLHRVKRVSPKPCHGSISPDHRTHSREGDAGHAGKSDCKPSSSYPMPTVIGLKPACGERGLRLEELNRYPHSDLRNVHAECLEIARHAHQILTRRLPRDNQLQTPSSSGACVC